MSDTKIGMRYAHSEGHMSMCYNDDGSFLLTCGGDGDVRIWQDLEDDDPESKHVGELVYSIVFKKNRFLVATDSNSILAYTFPDNKADGLVCRFAAPVNHMCLSKDGETLLAGSSDFSIKVVKVLDNSFKVLLGHEAPILSVDLDPSLEFAASSSCDGSVRIWKIAKQACVKSWANVVPTSNDFCASKVLCRLAWHPVDGKVLAVPVGQSVKCYSRDSWSELAVLTDESITEMINLVKFSRCGRFLAGACVNGVVVVWDFAKRTCVKRERHEKRLTICDAHWNPKANGELAFCDTQGQLGVFVNMFDATDLAKDSTVVDYTASTYPPISIGGSGPKKNDLDDDFPPLDFDDDDEDENTFSISKIKAETVGLEKFDDDDDDDVDLDAGDQKPVSGDTASTKITGSTAGVTESILSKLSQMQEPFQPGSTPVYYRHRFMTWNSVGIVRGYNTDDENAIDVEFHDTATHHAMRMENTIEHTMSDLSTTAVLLACKAKNGNPSKLVCNNFGAWDGGKEWTIDMPDDENIEAIAVGPEFAAASTNQRQLRLFNIGGVQRHVVSLPGPVVAMSGHLDQLIVVYHQGMGIQGDQSMGVMRVNLANRRLHTSNHPLPLSPKSTLAWIGFTDEGNPCCSDSAGVVRYLPGSLGQAWVQIANTKSHTKGKSDNYFIVGLSESQQQIRCILCKGAKYPSTLPHPMVTVLSFELPLCGLSSEKGKLEESYWRHSLLLDTFAWLDEQGYETDSILADRSKKSRKEDLIKLFALSCRGDRESCALELAQMMDSHQTVQLAIKYASRQKRLQLAERVGEVAYQMMEQEEKLAADANAPSCREQQSQRPVPMGQQTSTSQYSESEHEDNYVADEQDSYDVGEVQSVEKPLPRPVVFSSSKWNNPFKTSLTKPNREAVDGKRSGILDNLPMSSSTPKVKPPSSIFTTKAGKTAAAQPATKSNIKVQRTLQQFSKKKNKETVTKDTNPEHAAKESNKSTKPQKSGYQLWLDANIETIKADNPDSEDGKFALLAVQTFKKLSPEERQSWNNKAKATKENLPDKTVADIARKRTMSSTDADETLEEIPGSPQMFEDETEFSPAAPKRFRSEEPIPADKTDMVSRKFKQATKDTDVKKSTTTEKKKEMSKLIGSKLSSFAFQQ